jgi:hypothetical protein
MRTVSAAFTAAVRQSHERVSRVTLLDTELTVLGELTGVGGVSLEASVTMDAARRRSFSMTVADPDGIWTPAGPTDALFPNRLLRLERGIMIGGSPELVSLGVFLIDRPQTNVTAAGSVVTVTGQDRVKLALKSRFTVPTTFEAGRPIAEVVQAIAQVAGMGLTLYRLNDGGKVLAADRTFQTDADRWPSLVALAADYALEAYVDADGYLVLAPAITEATIPAASWVFERGADAVMLGITKDLTDDRLYNHVRISGESSDLPPVAAEARDLNPASPAYNPPDGSGPIGDRLLSETSPGIRSVEQAADVAAVRLPQIALIEEALSIPSVVHPALEVGDAVVVDEPQSRTQDTYLLDTVMMPLGGGPMTVTARKLRSLVA